MTVSEFDNGYWYATELKAFATAIGIHSASRLRKDELERAVKHCLRTGKVPKPVLRPSANGRTKDIDRGLTLGLRVTVYTNDPETKNFLEREALKLSPGMKRKSGARYRLNRWREEQIATGVKLTYRHLVKEYVRLNDSEKQFARIPHGRYINFVSDFMRAEPGTAMEDVVRAWAELKRLDAPKTYRSWKNRHRWSR